jgi:hypothetical protein
MDMKESRRVADSLRFVRKTRKACSGPRDASPVVREVHCKTPVNRERSSPHLVSLPFNTTWTSSTEFSDLAWGDRVLDQSATVHDVDASRDSLQRLTRSR